MREYIIALPQVRHDALLSQETISLLQSAVTLFDDYRAIAVVTTMAQSPVLMEEVGRLRSLCFHQEAQITGESYSIDVYDEYYQHIVVLDKRNGALIGAMRLGLGDKILATYGWEGLYTARYWYFNDGMIGVIQQGIEGGRLCIHPAYQKQRRGLSLLWKALSIFLTITDYQFYFGTVDLAGYPQPSRDMIMHYLWHYHRREPVLVSPKWPVPLGAYESYAEEHKELSSAQALRKLVTTLEQMNPAYSVPELLRRYARFDAELAGACATLPAGIEASFLLLSRRARFQSIIERLKDL